MTPTIIGEKRRSYSRITSTWRFLGRLVCGSGTLAILALCTLVVAAIGLTLHPRLLLLVPALIAALVLGSVWPWIVILGGRGTLFVTADRVHEGERVDCRLTLRNRGLLPAWGMLLDASDNDVQALPALRPLSSVELPMAFRPRQRGVFPHGPIRLQTGFPFGFLTASRRVRVDSALLVWPRVFPVAAPPVGAGTGSPTGRVETRRAGVEGDTTGVRAYRRGDPMRWIHWPQTARQDRFMVREFQAVGSSRWEIVLDCDPRTHVGDEHEGSFEWAVRIAASLAIGWLDCGSEVALRAGPTRIRMAGGHRQRKFILDALSRVRLSTDGVGAETNPTPTTIFIGTDLGWTRRTGVTAGPLRGFLLHAAGFGGHRTEGCPALSAEVVRIGGPSDVPAALCRTWGACADVA